MSCFGQGVLVQALRQGYWIILDELNLAPSEVLEALNRVLDNNRELFLSETQEIIKPHPAFRLFATQNPPGVYGGRKPLSRAFRNRFLEVHVGDIPGEEWETILEKRCGVPPSHCKLLVGVLQDLQARRQTSRLFLGKHGPISPRDLLRWAGRSPQGKQELAEEGYMLLAERLRREEEKMEMKNVLEEKLGVSIDTEALYSSVDVSLKHDQEEELADTRLGNHAQLLLVQDMLDKGMGSEAGLEGVALTRHMRRLFRLVGRCLSNLEPVLLVGETGCGKTTVCQLYSTLLGRRMHVVNCHQNTEAADLLGGLRPLRGRDLLVKELRDRATLFLEMCAGIRVENVADLSKDRDQPVMESGTVKDIISAIQAAWSKAQSALLKLQTQHTILVHNCGDGAQPVGESAPNLSAKRIRLNGGEERDMSTRCEDAQEQCLSVDQVVDEKDIGHDEQKRKQRGNSKRRRKHFSGAVKTSSTNKDSSDQEESNSSKGQAGAVIGSSCGESMHNANCQGLKDKLEEELVSLQALGRRCQGLFEWADGPLVTAMRRGELLLLDELSLAEDAVLERLNSVLESGRSITLAEKGGGESEGIAETVVAAPGFRHVNVMATMNPGGDFGKRELSPALRSRFTEVWVPGLFDRADMEGVVIKALKEVNSGGLQWLAEAMLDFAWWFNREVSTLYAGGHGLTLSIRDLLGWAHFISNVCGQSGNMARGVAENPQSVAESSQGLGAWAAYVHGASLIVLDGLGLGAGLSPGDVSKFKEVACKVLLEQVPEGLERSRATTHLFPKCKSLRFGVRYHTASQPLSVEDHVAPQALFGSGDFWTPCGGRPLPDVGTQDIGFSLGAATTGLNAVRVLRALQLRKAVLLEGSPGVGKTSLIEALARTSGHELVRINLSEQTDVSDLFGSDLPVPDKEEFFEGMKGRGRGDESGGGESGGARFAWCDGMFLKALKKGSWVLLDELNLASQNVLEGLNSCLDHREEVYIPELGQSFRCPPTFKVFAAQNPLGQGGGRKGLPKSFLSRFTKVFVDALTPEDLLHIAEAKFPQLAAVHVPSGKCSTSEAIKEASQNEKQNSLLAKMIRFNSLVQEDTSEKCLYGQKGGAWEFNLRDVFRWCLLILREQGVPDCTNSPLTLSMRSSVNDRGVNVEGSNGSNGGVGWEPRRSLDTLYVQRMRTLSDREAVQARFFEVFPNTPSNKGCGFEPSALEATGSSCSEMVCSNPELRVTPTYIQIGEVLVPRGTWIMGHGFAGYNMPIVGYELDGKCGGLDRNMRIPVGLRRPLLALARCVNMGWPSLIVGHRGTGKTSLVRSLATGVGAVLREVALSPATDISELLGCYEQVDSRSRHAELRQKLQGVTEQVCLFLMSPESVPANAVEAERKVRTSQLTRCAWDAWEAVRRSYISPLSHDAGIGCSATSGFDVKGIVTVEVLLGALESATVFLKDLHRGTSSEADGTRKNKLLNLEWCVHNVRLLASAVRSSAFDVGHGVGRSSPSFQWCDGVLVNALERGEWLLLDGANLCSSSVLDRLNPLLELGGELVLTECGGSSTATELVHPTKHPDCGGKICDNSLVPEFRKGGARIIKPHPNFRLFLTSNPACGEVSRAMRNRCVEISLLGTNAVSLPPQTCGKVSPDDPDSMDTETSGFRLSSQPRSDNVADLLGILFSKGVCGVEVAVVVLLAHSGMALQYGYQGHGDGNGVNSVLPRALMRWCELVDIWCSRNGFEVLGGESLTKTLLLSYPLTRGDEVVSSLDVINRWVSYKRENEGPRFCAWIENGLLMNLVEPSWKEMLQNSTVVQARRDSRVLGLVLLAIMAKNEGSGASNATMPLFSMVLGEVGIQSMKSDSNSLCPLQRKHDDAQFFLQPWEVKSSTCLSGYVYDADNILESLVPFAAAEVVRRLVRTRTGREDEFVPVMSGMDACSGSIQEVMAKAVKNSTSLGIAQRLLENLFDTSPSLMGSSVEKLVVDAFSKSFDQDPRTNVGLTLRVKNMLTCRHPYTWAMACFLLDYHTITVGRRLPLIAWEEITKKRAQARVRNGCTSNEEGLGWVGLSYFAVHGNVDLEKSGRYLSPETSVARQHLVRYLLPLLASTDKLVGCFVSEEMAEDIVCMNVDRHVNNKTFVLAIDVLMKARDDLLQILQGGAGSLTVMGKEVTSVAVFPWDLFFVGWGLYEDALESLENFLTGALGAVSVEPLKTLHAICARVRSAIAKQTGRVPQGHSMHWEFGVRAAVPWLCEGWVAIRKVQQISESFGISSFPTMGRTDVSEGFPKCMLGSMLRKVHPSLFVGVEERKDVLCALCTVQYAATSERGTRRDGNIDVGTSDAGNTSILDTVPRAVEESLGSARSLFQDKYRSVRLGTVEGDENPITGVDDNINDGSDKFDYFETEAAKAIAGASLLVLVEGKDVGGCSERVVEGFARVPNVMHRWGKLQLSPIAEHWLATEECHVLAALTVLEGTLSRQDSLVGSSLKVEGERETECGNVDRTACQVGVVMERVEKLRSAMLSILSLPPSTARPYQTLLWAWDAWKREDWSGDGSENFECGVDLVDRKYHQDGAACSKGTKLWRLLLVQLLRKLLPVMIDGWGKRLWINLYSSLEFLSAELAPPPIIPINVEGAVVCGADRNVEGPSHLLSCVRTSFILGLCSFHSFGGDPKLFRLTGERGGLMTLMNAEARRKQFQVGMRMLRRWSYQQGGVLHGLLTLAWGGLEKILSTSHIAKRAGREVQDVDLISSAHEIKDDVQQLEGPKRKLAFLNALQHLNDLSNGEYMSCTSRELEQAVRSGSEICDNAYLKENVNTLLVPSVLVLHKASMLFSKGMQRDVGAPLGMGLALLGCLRMNLLVPMSPVDPGLRPALRKNLVERRLRDAKLDLTARRWALRLEGRGDTSPEVDALLGTAHELKGTSIKLEREAIERPINRPSFLSLFQELHSFGTGIGSPDRIVGLTQELATLVGLIVEKTPDKEFNYTSFNVEPVGTSESTHAVGQAVQKERVWQAAAGSFVTRLREVFWSYLDVTTGICEAVETMRLGLRLLASTTQHKARHTSSPVLSIHGPGSEAASMDSSRVLHKALLVFPYTACKSTDVGLNTTSEVRDNAKGSFDKLARGLEDMRCAMIGWPLEDTSSRPNVAVFRDAARAQQAALLEALLCRAELYQAVGCGRQSLKVAASAMEIAVNSWARAEEKKAEEQRKKDEILKYKVQEHIVVGDEEREEERLKSLFPDFSAGYNDIFDDSVGLEGYTVELGNPEEDQDQATDGVVSGSAGAFDGRFSEAEVSSLVKAHARLFLTSAVQKKQASYSLCNGVQESGGASRKPVVEDGTLDSARLLAIQRSYRAATLLSLHGKPLLSTERRLGNIGAASDTESDGLESCNVEGDLEDEFACSHLLTLADASLVCSSGSSLLLDTCQEACIPNGTIPNGTMDRGKANPKIQGIRFKSQMSGMRQSVVSSCVFDRSVVRSFSIVDPLVDFYHDANVVETRLADKPLAGIIGKVAKLLGEFPGHGILIQLARVADRIRRMPLHSPVGAVLAGVEVTLSKAQEWEQQAHRGIRLSEELNPLSALVTRWRALELRSWSLLLDSRERSYTMKAHRWWFYLYRLLLGDWENLKEGEGMTQIPQLSNINSQANALSAVPRVDWLSAQECFAGRDWMWLGLTSADAPLPVSKTEIEAEQMSVIMGKRGGLEHAQGLFDTLDTFLRTAPIGEFFARLELIHVFAIQLSRCDDVGNQDSSLGTLLYSLWRYYSQFAGEVASARDAVRQGIEKKLKEEAKLAKWDEQTYYSLAESSEKSHRKLTKLLRGYEEILEVSSAEVLHGAITEGVGERAGSAGGTRMGSPSTDVPSLFIMFGMVKKVDSEEDFMDDAETKEEGDSNMVLGAENVLKDSTVHLNSSRDFQQPVSNTKLSLKRKGMKGAIVSHSSLRALNECLPKEPLFYSKVDFPGWSWKEYVRRWRGFDLPDSDLSESIPSWILEAFVEGASKDESAAPYIMRLPGLSDKMKLLLRRGIYGCSKVVEQLDDDGWAEAGRPAGLLGAGLSEEMCLAVFGRIQRLRKKTVGKQVKKRAVLDLLSELKKQGLSHAKAAIPVEVLDILQVMTSLTPFQEDFLAGPGCGPEVLVRGFNGDSDDIHETRQAVGEIAKRADYYYLKSLSEVMRLRLEASSPVAHDITRREAEVMRGLADHLGLLVLQQRGAVTIVERELSSFSAEIKAIDTLILNFQSNIPQPDSAPDGISSPSEEQVKKSTSGLGFPGQGLPPQKPLQQALNLQLQGMRCALESIVELQLFLRSVTKADPPMPSMSRMHVVGLGDTCLEERDEMKGMLDAGRVERAHSVLAVARSKICEMMDRLLEFIPEGVLDNECVSSAAVSSDAHNPEKKLVLNRTYLRHPLLGVNVLRIVMSNQELLDVVCHDVEGLLKCVEMEDSTTPLPPASVLRVVSHLEYVKGTVKTALSPCLHLLSPLGENASGYQCGGKVLPDEQEASLRNTRAVEGGNLIGNGDDVGSCTNSKDNIKQHLSVVGLRVERVVRLLLLSVQNLCRPKGSGVYDGKSSLALQHGTTGQTASAVAVSTSEGKGDGDDEVIGGWTTDTTLWDAHKQAFEQARLMKIWRCAVALGDVRKAVEAFTHAKLNVGTPEYDAASAAIISLCADLVHLARRVEAAAAAVMTGLIAFSKGSGKLHYVIVRVFRTLLSKGLCSDETEEGDGEGGGDIQGMKFDDDVEGTGMGEGEGKKDVSDQIEDEEQILGLKGDEKPPDQSQQPEESKELGEKEEDNGLEMENDFDGELFDIPKGEKEDESKDKEHDDKEELDREMGDTGDCADVVDEKMWDDDDGDDDEQAEKGEEKFEEGSRLDGQKLEEDEIRTREDGEADRDDKDKDGAKGEEVNNDDNAKKEDKFHDNAEGSDQEEDNGEIDEGPVNDDLEENYEDKTMGVEVWQQFL
ncbi:unnamed protein product [Choristocarpus tenellus]